MIDNGVIVEKGPHEELLNNNGHYSVLHQFGVLVVEVVI